MVQLYKKSAVLLAMCLTRSMVFAAQEFSQAQQAQRQLQAQQVRPVSSAALQGSPLMLKGPVAVSQGRGSSGRHVPMVTRSPGASVRGHPQRVLLETQLRAAGQGKLPAPQK